MLSAERLKLHQTRAHCSIPQPALQAVGFPPLRVRTAGGLSGRPRCRIFPVGRLWILQIETASGWLLGNGPDEPPMRLTFSTLAAAITYAEQRGYDYRVITPSPVARIAERRRRAIAGHRKLRRAALSPGQNNTEH